MPTMSIKVEVQAEAVGPVMILLRKARGVVGFHVDLDAFAPSAALSRPAGSPMIKDVVLAFLAKKHPEAVKAGAIASETQKHKPSVHAALNSLKSVGQAEQTIDKTWRLTETAAVEMGVTKLLAAPSSANGQAGNHDKPKITRRKTDVLWKHLYAVLKHGPMNRTDIAKAMSTATGMTEKAASSLLARMQAAKLAKSDGNGTWELTSRGKAKTPTNELLNAA